jgi:hypothetical protein
MGPISLDTMQGELPTSLLIDTIAIMSTFRIQFRSKVEDNLRPEIVLAGTDFRH